MEDTPSINALIEFISKSGDGSILSFAPYLFPMPLILNHKELGIINMHEDSCDTPGHKLELEANEYVHINLL